jgi:hypothetical protein
MNDGRAFLRNLPCANATLLLLPPGFAFFGIYLAITPVIFVTGTVIDVIGSGIKK